MSRRLPLALLLATALLGGGCGTLDNIQRPVQPPALNPDAPVCRVYGGVRSDWDVISQYQWSRTTSFLDYIFIPVLATIDLALDVVADTVTLPYTLYAEISRSGSRSSSSSPVEPITVPNAATEPAPGTTPAPPTPPNR